MYILFAAGLTLMTVCVGNKLCVKSSCTIVQWIPYCAAAMPAAHVVGFIGLEILAGTCVDANMVIHEFFLILFLVFSAVIYFDYLKTNARSGAGAWDSN